MRYTSEQLQLALAKMTDKIAVTKSGYVHWNVMDGDEVKETEWLHVCWLVEQKDQHGSKVRLAYSSSWQQRAIALAKVKGIKI